MLNIVLCWHMHQPYYRKALSGKYYLPWVYLHGIKDYTDMAVHFENHPKMRGVVNFSPILLEQLDDYVHELKQFLNNVEDLSINISDPVLALLTGVEEIPTDVDARKKIVNDCKRCHAPRLIEPYPAFKRIVDCLDDALQKVDDDHPFPLNYLEDQYFIDLLVWYHLAWMGFSLKQSATIKRLIAKEHGFTLEDRYELLTVIYDALAGIIPRYKNLADRGQIELSLTPYSHPIIPLLNDFANMDCALPDAPAPDCENYPGGVTRARWHMQKGIEVFEHYFDRKPQGFWLSEGGVSDDALDLLDEYGISWTASGEAVWKNTCHLNQYSGEEVTNKKALFRPYQYKNSQAKIYFRDDGLSDFIGFEYSHWNAQDAAKNFIEHLTNIEHFLGDEAEQHVVSIILDGENAWEYYLDNGYHFLDAFYQGLVANEKINPSTFFDVSKVLEAKHLEHICAGSWVYGSFSTWIGQRDKNHAWELLVAAKKAYDQKIEQLNAEQQIQAELQLAICEGSDWFWWFGDYNSNESVNDFDILFRLQLQNLYEMLQLEAPKQLQEPISKGGGISENAGTMRRNK